MAMSSRASIVRRSRVKRRDDERVEAARVGKYTIGVVSQLLDIHPQTLRAYEKSGLVSPGRSSGNTRLYCDEDVERLEKILHLSRDLGVNLAGVEIIFGLLDRIEKMEEAFEEEKKKIWAQAKQDVEHFINRYLQSPPGPKVLPPGKKHRADIEA